MITLIHQSSDLYGSDRSFLSVVRALLNHGLTDQVVVILPQNGELSDQIRSFGVKVVIIPFGYLRKAKLRHPLSFMFEVYKGVRAIAKIAKQSDMVYINTVVCISAMISIRLHRKKAFIHVREIPANSTVWLFGLLLRWSKAELIFNSHATMRAFGLPGTVVYNGVAESVRNEIIQPNGTRNRLLLVGRINSWKGHILLLKAIDEIECPLKLRIVGSPAEGCEELHTRIRALASRSRHEVELIDFVENPSEHYLWADFTVVPSTKPEPFGRVAIESLLYGKPVIAADHGGLPEIVVPSSNGFLFTPNNHVDLAMCINKALTLTNEGYSAVSKRCKLDYSKRFTEKAYQENVLELMNIYKI